MRFELQTGGDRPELSSRVPVFPAHVSLGLLSCAAVSTAQWLGTGWVSYMVLGAPVGIWLVGGVVGGAVAWERRARGAHGRGTNTSGWMAELGTRMRELMGKRVGRTTGRLFGHPIYAREVDAVELGPELIRPDDVKRERRVRPARPEATPRIGVSGPEEFVEAFVEQVREEQEVEARFEPVAIPVRESAECVKRSLSGAVSFTEAGQTAIVLPEYRGREAAWSDWSQRLALSYPAVFPPRVDPARIVCGPVRIRSARESRLIARLAEASSLLSQVQARTGARRSPEQLAAHHNRMSRSMIALARTFTADWGGRDLSPAAASPVCRTAARAISGWLSMCDTGIDPQERRLWIDACSAYLADEPEAHLRLAAAHIAAFEDDDAIPALERAFSLMRESGERPLSDPVAFVMAEMDLGTYNSLALGRVAAGLAIAWATTPLESLDYLRDDLIDDLRYSGKLMGRDHDHALLKRVMSLMDRMRSEGTSMKAAA